MAKARRTPRHLRAKPEADAPVASSSGSAAKPEKIRQAAELKIDKFMKRVGYDNPAERTDENGWRWLKFGSAQGRAGVVESDSDGEMYLRAEALAMELPSDPDQALPFMRELLEMNMTIPGAARLGINGQGVFVCGTIPLPGLTVERVAAHIHSVMEIAASFGHPINEQLEPAEASQEQVDIPLEKQPDPVPQAA